MNRFDKLKSMKLEEMADYLHKNVSAKCSVCAYEEDDWHCFNSCCDCVNGIRLWLEDEDAD